MTMPLSLSGIGLRGGGYSKIETSIEGCFLSGEKSIRAALNRPAFNDKVTALPIICYAKYRFNGIKLLK